VLAVGGTLGLGEAQVLLRHVALIPGSRCRLLGNLLGPVVSIPFEEVDKGLANP
jgi:hypothetical protein